MKNILFRQKKAIGDMVVFTSALRDLCLSYPKFKVGVLTYYPEIFENNPYCVADISCFSSEPEIVDINDLRSFSDKRETGIHFSDAYIMELNERLGLNIKKTSMYPEIYLNDKEKSNLLLDNLGIKKPFWLFNAGFKTDVMLKAYPYEYWKVVIEKLKEKGIQLYQVGHSHNINPSFKNVASLVGKTDAYRDYFSLVNHSNGCIGGVSLQMHVAAAFRKPCVVLAGGREEFRWEAYQNHSYLHTVGKLDCCRYGGCWKSNIYDCLHLDKKNKFPMCMLMVDPSEVVKAVLDYESIGGNYA